MLDVQTASTLLLFIITVALVVILGRRTAKQTTASLTMDTSFKKDDNCESGGDNKTIMTTNANLNDNMSLCAACGKSGDDLRECTACRLVKYCNRDCQISHRSKHKKLCKQRAAELSAGDNSTADTLSVCANCGKGEADESDKLKSCDACKMVKYCSRECQIAHRPLHKKECKKRAAELHEEALFKFPPPPDDCDICMLPLSPRTTANTYYSCCGKIMCKGCDFAYHIRDSDPKSDTKCPYCRRPTFGGSLESISERFEERMEAGDANAYHEFGRNLWTGRYVTQDRVKAMKLWHQAGEMGCTAAYHDICDAYFRGEGGVERDMKKCRYYCELAAMGGYVKARMDLGLLEINAGSVDRAVKHLLIAAGCGSSQSLDIIKQLYSRGEATKDEYTKALRVFQSYLPEIRSKQRDEAAEFHESCKYY